MHKYATNVLHLQYKENERNKSGKRFDQKKKISGKRKKGQHDVHDMHIYILLNRGGTTAP